MSKALLEKMMRLGTSKSFTLSNSTLFQVKNRIKTPLPILNIAFSGDKNRRVFFWSNSLCG